MATEIAKPRNSYEEAFRALQGNTQDSSASWLAHLRESAMDRFAELGFPSVKEEEWKYTNVAPIARIDFRPVILPDAAGSGIDAQRLAGLGCVEAENSQLVFVNGALRNDLSSLTRLPEEVVAIDLSQAMTDDRYAQVERTHLARYADYVANGFTALNTAFVSSGAFIYIPTGITVNTPIHLLFISDGAQMASFPRVLIVAEENSSATLIESHVSTQDVQYFTNAVVEVVLKDGARIEHYKVQRESVTAFHVATTVADLGSNASYDATTITFGAALSRHDINVTFDHAGAE